MTLPELTGPANLMMHIYPRRETAEIWQAQLAAIRAAFPQFSGRKILYVATDETTDHRSIDFCGWDYVTVAANRPDEWEFPGWRWAMNILKNAPGFTIRLHGKGAVRGTPVKHLQRWWELSYESLLDVDAVRESLARAVITGPFRLNKPAQNMRVPWIYAGAMYAFRNAEIFARDWQPEIRGCPLDHYVEAWPAVVASRAESACLRFDGVKTELYSAAAWEPARTPTKESASRGVSFAVTPPLSVAIVIAGRNNAEFLPEAIETALQQSIPCEVVYADDASSDDSVAVAIRYAEQGLRVLPSGNHAGVCQARNRGARATRAPYLIHLDSDDRLPPNFAELHLQSIQSAPFAYGPAQAFGATTTLWTVPEWDQFDLWRQNTVNTSAIYARWAFEAAGGWQESADVPTMWDYDLAIRASRFGTPRTSPAVLQYRQHAGGFSHSIGEKSPTEWIQYAELIRRKNARVRVASLVSGRLLGLFPRWLDAVRSSVLFAHLPTRPSLLLTLHDAALDRADEYRERIRGCDDVFSAVEIQGMRRTIPQQPEAARRNGVASLLAEYSASAQSSPADLIWFVEDDVLTPRPALRKMFAEVTAGSNPPLAVSGVYRNRHRANQVIGGTIRDGRRIEPSDFSSEVQPVDFVGTGCLLFWTNRPASPQVWKSHCNLESQPAHDFAWSEAAAGKLLVDGSVRCGHAVSETEILHP